MAYNMKEVAILRGNDKLFEENASKIDWSGALGTKAVIGEPDNTILPDRVTTSLIGTHNYFENTLLTGNSFREDITLAIDYFYHLDDIGKALELSLAHEVCDILSRKYKISSRGEWK
jgi:hypothetical protein